MTERTQTSGPHNTAEAYAEEYRRLWDTTVATLTAAVRLNHPQHGAMDFADFLAAAFGAVAANVGSAERITAGRPGSWESDLLAQLVAGTVGYETTPEELAARRTEPVVVSLNVAQLVNEARTDAAEEERAGMLVDVEEAVEAIPDPWADGREPTDQEVTAWTAAQDDMRRRYAEAFEAYSQRFAAAVLDAAHAIPGLTVPVEVKAITTPDATWWDAEDTRNPQEWDDGDELAGRLWSAARGRVGLPHLDEQPSEH
jgi:hypothetical protein